MQKTAKSVKPGVVLAVGTIMQLFLGIIYIWSIFVNPVSEYFNQWDVSQVKLTSSFMLSCFVLGILAGGKLQLKITTQKTALLGDVLMAAGMLSSALLPNNAGMLIYLTYGIVGGFGVGLGYNAIITTAQRNFPQKRGLATGISVCSFGFSTVVFAPLAKYLIGLIGLQYTFLILGAVFLAVSLLCFSFIRMPSESAAASANANISDKKQYTTTEMLKTRAFYFITISMMLGTATYFILNPSFISIATERGLSDGIATVLVMSTGIANTLGRLIIPLASDKFGREITASAAILLTALSAVGLIFIGGYPLIGVICVIAFCYGGYSGIYPVITGDHFGLKNIGSNYGAVMVGFACSALLLPIILSPIADISVKFVVLAVLSVIGSTLIVSLAKKSKS